MVLSIWQDEIDWHTHKHLTYQYVCQVFAEFGKNSAPDSLASCIASVPDFTTVVKSGFVHVLPTI